MNVSASYTSRLFQIFKPENATAPHPAPAHLAANGSSRSETMWNELSVLLTQTTEELQGSPATPTSEAAQILAEISPKLDRSDLEKLGGLLTTLAQSQTSTHPEKDVLMLLKTLQLVHQQGDALKPFLNAASIIDSEGNQPGLMRFLSNVQDILKSNSSASTQAVNTSQVLLELCNAVSALYEEKNRKKLAMQAWYWFHLQWSLGDLHKKHQQAKAQTNDSLTMRSLPSGVAIDLAQLVLSEKSVQKSNEHSSQILALLKRNSPSDNYK